MAERMDASSSSSVKRVKKPSAVIDSIAVDDDSDSDDSDFEPGGGVSVSSCEEDGEGGSSASDDDDDTVTASQSSGGGSDNDNNSGQEEDDEDDDSSSSSTSSGGSACSRRRNTVVPTEEATEAAAQRKFRSALSDLVNEDRFDGLAKLVQLIKLPALQRYWQSCIDDFDWTETAPGQLSTMCRLFVSVNKNLAQIFSELGKPNRAIEHYMQALTILRSSFELWHALSIECVKAVDYELAVFALRECLKCRPGDFDCLDKLICLLYLCHNYTDCVWLLKDALVIRPDYVRGLVIKDEILHFDPYLRVHTKSWFADPDFETVHQVPVEERQKILDKLTDLAVKRSAQCVKTAVEPPYHPVVQLEMLSLAGVGEALSKLFTEMLEEGVPAGRVVGWSSWQASLAAEHSVVEEEHVESCVVEMRSDDDAVMADLAIESSEESAMSECSGVAGIEATCSPEAAVHQQACSSNEQDVQQLLSSLIDRVVSMEKRVLSSKRKLDSSIHCSKTRATKRRYSRIEEMTCVDQSSSLASDSDGEAASLFKRRSSRFVPGYSIEDNFLNASKTIPMDEMLESLLPVCLKHFRNIQQPMLNAFNGAMKLCGQSSADGSGKGGVVSPGEKSALPDLRDEACRLVDSWYGLSALDALRSYLIVVTPFIEKYSCSDKFRSTYLDCVTLLECDAEFCSPLDADSQFMRQMVLDTGKLYLVAAELIPKDTEFRYSNRFLVKILGRISFLANFSDFFGYEFCCRASWITYKSPLIIDNRRHWLESAVACIEQLSSQLSIKSDQVIPTAAGLLSKAMIDAELEEMERTTFLKAVDEHYDCGHYEEVASNLLHSFTSSSVAMQTYELVKYGIILVKTFRKLGRVSECIAWSRHLLDIIAADRVKSDDKTKQLEPLSEVLENLEHVLKETRAFDDDALIILVSPLIQICKLTAEIISDGGRKRLPTSLCITPWLLLYTVANRLELKSTTIASLSDLFRTVAGSKVVLAFQSLMILRTAHSKLGQLGLCDALDSRLPLVYAEELSLALHHPIVQDLVCEKDSKFKNIKDHMLNEAEQCFYCLYKFPTKKKRHLAEHHCEGIELTWERVFELFDFVLPESHQVPAFDDVVTNVVSADAVQLFNRMSDLIPAADKPTDDDVIKFCQFLFNAANVGSAWPSLASDESASSNRWTVAEMHYLLGDYLFKTGDFEAAINHYRRYLIVAGAQGTHVFNAWGGSALAGAAVLLQKIQVPDSFQNGMWDIDRCSQSTFFAFDSALLIEPTHRILHNEYAETLYQYRAYVSRAAKLLGPEDIRSRVFKRQAAYLLLRAKTQFEMALNLLSASESGSTNVGADSWLCHYYLGKIGEKLDHAPADVLVHYHCAAVALRDCGAKYSDRISYKPKRFDLEALEMHYRVHAAVLKWLNKRNYWTEWSVADLRVMDRYLEMFMQHGVCRNKQRNQMSASYCCFNSDPDVAVAVNDCLDAVVVASQSRSPTPLTAVDADAICVEAKELLDSVVERVSLVHRLYDRCVNAMRLCIRRFQNSHYKAFYRLAHCYFTVQCMQSCDRAHALLFGPVAKKDHKNPVTTALFQMRRPTNAFESLWRLPVDDIDRTGSFSMHMNRCCRLAILVAAVHKDFIGLSDFVLALSRKPTESGKSYVSEMNRGRLFSTADRFAKIVLAEHIRKIDGEKLKLVCVRIFEIRRTLEKHCSTSCANRWRPLLKQAFCRLINISVAVAAHRDFEETMERSLQKWTEEYNERKRNKTITKKVTSAEAKRRKMEQQQEQRRACELKAANNNGNNEEKGMEAETV